MDLNISQCNQHFHYVQTTVPNVNVSSTQKVGKLDEAPFALNWGQCDYY